MKITSKFAIGILVILLGFGIMVYKNNSKSFGAYNPTGGGTYRIQSSIGATDTSIVLSSFKEPVSNIPYTMAYLNSSIEYATIEPQTITKEFISFTGITQNTDGTATLTGVTRGLAFSYPYTASTTLRQGHSGQSILILSNPPQMTNMYANKSNDETISGIWTFNASPILPTPTTATQGANKSYVDGVALACAPNADETTKGVAELATAAETAAGTSAGGTGARLVLPASLATSTPGNSIGTGNIVATISGKIAQAFLDLTQNFTFSGQTVISTSTQYTINVGSLNATSTIKLNGANVLTTASASITGAVSTSTTFALPTAHNDNTSGVVYCVSPKVVSGGGFSGVSGSSGTVLKAEIVIANYPSATNAWTVTVQCEVNTAGADTCDGGTATVYAICVNP